MTTHDISLPSNQRALFPLRCVCCETAQPIGTFPISVIVAAKGPSLSESACEAVFGTTPHRRNQRITVNVPACHHCGRSLARRHLWKTALLYLGVLAGLAGFILGLASRGSFLLATLGLLVGISGPVIWELISPPAFTLTQADDQISYEFRSQRCATEFQQLNCSQQKAEL